MSKRRLPAICVPIILILVFAIATLFTSGYAWYQVAAPEISVSSSSVMVQTANLDYGEFEATHLYIVEPNIGEVSLDTPANPKYDIRLSPVSTQNGINYYVQYGDKKLSTDTGYYRFVVEVAYAQMTNGMDLNCYVDIPIPTSNAVQKPDWARAVLRASKGRSTQQGFIPGFTPGDHAINTPITSGLMFVRDPSVTIQGLGDGGTGTVKMRTVTMQKGAIGATSSFNSGIQSTSGTLWIELTTYLEGSTPNTTDLSFDGELPVSLFVYPSRHS